VKLAVFVSLLMLLAAHGASAAELGRLFHTSAERKALDASRQEKKGDRLQSSPKRAPARLEGFVVRSDGAATVWIDGRAVRVPARER
jgi:hypothetical protein